MPKKNSKKASAKKAQETKKSIDRILNTYDIQVSNNGIKWNRNEAKKVYYEAKKNKISFRQQIKNKIDNSIKNRSYYVARKYDVDIDDARNIVKDKIRERIPYKENELVIESKTRRIVFEDLKPITGLTNFVELKNEVSKPGIKFVIYEGNKYSVEDFIKMIPIIRQHFQELCERLNIDFNYARISYVYQFQIKNDLISINILPDNEIKNTVSDTEKNNQ